MTKMKNAIKEIIENNISLDIMTTLNVGGPAEYFARVKDISVIPRLVAFAVENHLEILVLGEGSNVVISDNGFKGLVVKLETNNIELLSETPDSVLIKVDGGCNWDSLVAHTVNNGWWGLENMSLIPGSVGASPVQNVGAYGQECKNVINSVNVYDTKTNTFTVIENADCDFSFRESIFNTTEKDRYIITSVEFKLNKKSSPILTRPELRVGLDFNLPSSELQMRIRKRVIELRTSGKALPNKLTQGSAGTFYRTTVVSLSKLMSTFFKSLFKLGPKIAIIIVVFGWRYRSTKGYRVPSRMIIDACGLQALSVGDVRLYESNSAVLVTDKNGSPKAADIVTLTKQLRKLVYKKTGFKVPIEPTLVGFNSSELKDIFNLQ